MARAPVSLLRRSTTKKGRFIYYIRLWIPEEGRYSTAQSAAVVAEDLGVNVTAWPPTTRAGALHIAGELIAHGGGVRRKNDPLLIDYCATFWDWEKSEYIKGKIDRGQQIGKPYCHNMKTAVELHIAPRAQGVRLREVTAQFLDRLALRLKNETKLGARAINAALSAVTTPLREAHRLGVIARNPAERLHKIGNDTRAKGIPTEKEVAALFASEWDDDRHRLAVALGYSAGLRLGEVLGLQIQDIEDDAEGAPLVSVSASWSALEGKLKGTKTNGSVRRVPIPEDLRDDLRKLAGRNPHKGGAFVFWSDEEPEEPITPKIIESAFYRQLKRIGIDEETRKARVLSFHSLRHLFNATLRGAIPDEILRKATGHATTAMTDHYDHSTAENLAAIRKAQEEKIISFRKAE